MAMKQAPFIPVTAVPTAGVVFKLLIGQALFPLLSVTQALLPSGVMPMPREEPRPVIALPSAGVIFKLLIGQALPPEKSDTQAVLPPELPTTTKFGAFHAFSPPTLK